MAIELEAPPRRFRRPVRRFYGRGYYGPVYQDPVVIEVERTEPALPWRVTSTNSYGQSVHMQTASMQEALSYFKNKVWKSTAPGGGGVNAQLSLQHWTGSGWKTEASRNSQDWLSATTVRGKAGYG